MLISNFFKARPLEGGSIMHVVISTTRFKLFKSIINVTRHHEEETQTINNNTTAIQSNMCKTATLKKTDNLFSRPIIAECRSMVRQNAPR